MTRRLIVLLGLLIFGLVGCSRDDEVNAFVESMNAFTAELVSKVDSATDKKAGVDAAVQHLNGKGAELKSQFESLQDVRGFQVKEETMSNLTTAVTENVTKVAGLKLKYLEHTMKDKELDQKLDKLTEGYSALFGQ